MADSRLLALESPEFESLTCPRWFSLALAERC
jgi:hypothetical protein